MTEQSSTTEPNVSETKYKNVKLEMPPPSTTVVPKRLKIPKPKFNCAACEKSYKHQNKLKYHIRSKHFNLKAQTSTIHKKNINDVWFEKVTNTDCVVEIKKVSDSKIIIRRSDSKDVNTDKQDIVDVTELYPTTYSGEKVECNECQQIICKKDFKKHFKLMHSDSRQRKKKL